MRQQTKTKGWIGYGQDKNYQRGKDKNKNNGATDKDVNRSRTNTVKTNGTMDEE